MFDPRYHGTTFDVKGTFDDHKETLCHVVTSRDYCELISKDWKTALHKFQPSEIRTVELSKDKTGVLVTMIETAATKSILLEPLIPSKREHLQSALTSILRTPNPQIQFLALGAILPMFKLPDQQRTMLHKTIMERSKEFLKVFYTKKGDVPQNGPFVDVFSCLYRFRYSNDAARAVTENAAALEKLLYGHVLMVWCNAITKCTAPTQSPNVKLFWTTLAGHIMDTITTVANVLGLSSSELASAVNEFKSTGNGEGIAPAAKALGGQVKDKFDNDFRANIPFDALNLKMFMNIALLVMSGVATGLYLPDIEVLARAFVQYTKTVQGGSDGGQAKKTLDAARNTYLSELLVYLDGCRYEKPFQFVFCVWDLALAEENRLKI